MSEMPTDPFVAVTHTCTAPVIPTSTISEIMRERFKRIDECLACVLDAMSLEWRP